VTDPAIDVAAFQEFKEELANTIGKVSFDSISAVKAKSNRHSVPKNRLLTGPL